MTEDNNKFIFYFAVHRDDWQYFRSGIYELNGQEVSQNVSYKEFFERINVDTMIDIVPEHFRACQIEFQDSDDVIAFFEKVQKNNVTLFSLKEFE